MDCSQNYFPKVLDPDIYWICAKLFGKHGQSSSSYVIQKETEMRSSCIGEIRYPRFGENHISPKM